LSGIPDKEPTNKTKVKKEQIRKVHVVLIQSAVDKLTREELERAKYGLEFSDRPSPVNLIQPERKPEPMRFSLANLFPVGV
jgi:hypothetical protein